MADLHIEITKEYCFGAHSWYVEWRGTWAVSDWLVVALFKAWRRHRKSLHTASTRTKETR